MILNQKYNSQQHSPLSLGPKLSQALQVLMQFML